MTAWGRYGGPILVTLGVCITLTSLPSWAIAALTGVFVPLGLLWLKDAP